MLFLISAVFLTGEKCATYSDDGPSQTPLGFSSWSGVTGWGKDSAPAD